VKREHWGMSLDELSEAIYQMPNDAIGGHYIAFKGSKAVARQKLIDAFTALIDHHMYRANDYGSRWQEGDDDDN
jgi:hypothetical protein